jgi:hypothetical protein
MGKTISVTIPTPLVEDLQKSADIVGISRSRFISNLLLKWQEKNKTGGEETEEIVYDTPPNNCPNREGDGFCTAFDLICNAKQTDAETCSGFPGKEKGDI